MAENGRHDWQSTGTGSERGLVCDRGAGLLHTTDTRTERLKGRCWSYIDPKWSSVGERDCRLHTHILLYC